MGKKRICIKSRCDEPPHLSGLCKQHYDEQRKMELDRETAIEVLNTRIIEGQLPTKEGLFKELTKARHWLDKAHAAMRKGKQDSILLDETEYAPEWCIAIAKAIIDEEISHRKGGRADFALKHIKELSWERFSNLEAGLMSNGIARPDR